MEVGKFKPGTMKFPIGFGKDVVDMFCQKFKSFYEKSHTFVSDVTPAASGGGNSNSVGNNEESGNSVN
jgi:hypothetical protein